MGETHVFRLSQPAIRRGIKTNFDAEEKAAIDWQVAFTMEEAKRG